MDMAKHDMLTVLLKEMRSGQLASEEQVARFWHHTDTSRAVHPIPSMGSTGLVLLVLLMLLVASQQRQRINALKALLCLCGMGVTAIVVTPTAVEAQVPLAGIQVKVSIENGNELIIEKYVVDAADTEAPQLSAASQTFTTTVGTPLSIPVLTATDNIDGSVAVQQTGTVDFNTAGTYTVTYTATDAAGNAATVTYTYKVVDAADTEAPQLSAASQTFTTTVGTPLPIPVLTATDNIDGSVAVQQTGTVDFNTAGTYTVTYTATDSAGNAATVIHTYKVNPAPNTAPKLSNPESD